ncbi:MAG: nucleoside triphosphate pyrophosphohydrolase [Gammaproteobacteria bacterium]|nr:MAG: nucleoside triphosphate pyrophosphohydrolase [Gammaproteobacteria bacterium]
MERLLEIMATLRDPERGCPWDRAQTFASIVPYTLEEAYEVADAIAREDWEDLRDELGDLLLQVVFYSQIAREQGLFDFADVVAAISDKMERRHPHVFAGQELDEAGRQAAWEADKEARRKARGESTGSVLDGVTRGLPALTRAVKLQKRAASVGFDWDAPEPVLEKVEEELGELRHELRAGAPHERLQDELGDLLFAVANLARHLGVDPEAALRGTNDKFVRRFHSVEQGCSARGRRPQDCSLEEMERLWQQAKEAETDRAGG